MARSDERDVVYDAARLADALGALADLVRHGHRGDRSVDGIASLIEIVGLEATRHYTHLEAIAPTRGRAA